MEETGDRRDEVEQLAGAVAGALTAAGSRVGADAIVGLCRLSGGASRETWSFTAAGRPLILQRTRGGGSLDGPSMAEEDELLVAATAVGVPVPPIVVDASTCGPFLGEARITAHVDGEALGPRIVRGDAFASARAVLPAQCGRALAAIHSIDPATVPGLSPVEPLERLRAGLDLLDEHRPAFELALRWLRDHRPPARPPTVVHGDFRIGNLLVDPERGLEAILDWELAHLGDPLEDLGWLCVRAWRFGGAGEVGGVGPLGDLLAAYADESGAPVAPEHVRWWIVVGTLTWGLICAVQARRHLDGHVRSVELATIGRRVVETEHDLLDLLGIAREEASGDEGTDGGDAREVPDPRDGLLPAGEGRPSAADLVDAVRTFLTDDVAPRVEGATAFQLKVAANALRIVERELRQDPFARQRVADLLASAGAETEEELAGSIRTDTVDADEWVLHRAVRATVTARLQVANPKWLAGP